MPKINAQIVQGHRVDGLGGIDEGGLPSGTCKRGEWFQGKGCFATGTSTMNQSYAATGKLVLEVGVGNGSGVGCGRESGLFTL